METKMASGFTLIELMVVVAVVAILGAIAYPSYSASVLKGRRAQARTALMELLQQQERYLTQRNCYMAFTNTSGKSTAKAAAICGITAATEVPFKNFSGDNAGGTAYWLSADLCSADATPTIMECVKLVATPTKADPEVGVLSLTSTGVKACSGSASVSNMGACWP